MAVKKQWGREGVRGLRRHLGLTQGELAAELGTRQQTISDWERGNYRPRGTSARLLSMVAERAGFSYQPGIRLHQGDITELEVEALVNAANTQLWMGGGVAGAIKRRGGEEIEREAVGKGPIPVGEAVVTGAGRLRAKYIIHAATMGPDLGTGAQKIRLATRNALKQAQGLGVKSLAFPALGAGVGGFPINEVARIMVEEVKEHLKGPTNLQEVVFVLRDEAAYRAFAQELG